MGTIKPADTYLDVGLPNSDAAILQQRAAFITGAFFNKKIAPSAYWWQIIQRNRGAMLKVSQQNQEMWANPGTCHSQLPLPPTLPRDVNWVQWSASTGPWGQSARP